MNGRSTTDGNAETIAHCLVAIACHGARHPIGVYVTTNLFILLFYAPTKVDGAWAIGLFAIGVLPGQEHKLLYF